MNIVYGLTSTYPGLLAAKIQSRLASVTCAGLDLVMELSPLGINFANPGHALWEHVHTSPVLYGICHLQGISMQS